MDICKVLKTAYDRKWISSRDGNASTKTRYSIYMYITPSGVRKQFLSNEMLIEIDTDFPDASVLNSKVKPSGELPLHVLLQKRISEASRVVLHLHPTYIVAAMYAGIDLQKLTLEFPEIHRYTRVGPTVEILPPVSEELAIASAKALGLDKNTGELKYDIIGLDRHGIIAVGIDAWDAFDHVERLEHICQVVLAAGYCPKQSEHT
jgi:ribulose-5-phosphate 4-epimerase/fuculose-1-phosphate aldolase